MARTLSLLSNLRPGARRVASNTSWLIVDRIARMGVGLFVGAWVARYLGTYRFGLYNFVIAIIAIVGILSTMGLDNIVVRDISRDPSTKDETLGAAFAIKLCGSILTILVAVSIVAAISSHERVAAWLALILSAGALFSPFGGWAPWGLS